MYTTANSVNLTQRETIAISFSSDRLNVYSTLTGADSNSPQVLDSKTMTMDMFILGGYKQNGAWQASFAKMEVTALWMSDRALTMEQMQTVAAQMRSLP